MRLEVVVAALVLAGLLVARHGLGARGLIGAFVATVLLVVSAIDLDRRIIPNVIVLPATAAVLTAQCLAFGDRAAEWVAAGLLAAAFLALPLLWVPGGVGMGDLKLALLMGVALGAGVIDALLYASLAAAGWALVLRARGADARTATFAFGPFLALGSIIALFTGHQLG